MFFCLRLSPKRRVRSSIQYAQETGFRDCERTKSVLTVWLVLLFAVLPFVVDADEVTEDKLIQFNVPEQPVDLALTQFAEQANITLLFPTDEIGELMSNELVGKYAVSEGADILLAGTGLIPTFKNKLVLNIALDQNNDVETNMNNRETAGGGLLAAVLSLFGTSGAQAEDALGAAAAEQVIEEIIVTATKRTGTLQDTPSAISAFSSKQLEEANLYNLNEIITFIPGASEELSANAGLRRYQIRGLTQGGGDPTVGYYIDDAAFFFYGIFYAPMGRAIDLERIEVLRGPQSTLYGAGSMGGTVRYITKQPNLSDFEGHVRAGYSDTDGGDPGHFADVAVSLPIVKDKLGVRLVGTYEEIGGFIEIPDLGLEDANDQETTHLRASVLWEPTDDLTLKFLYTMSKPETLSTGFATSERNETVTFSAPGDRYTSDYDLFIGTLNYDFGFASLTSTTSVLDDYHFLWLRSYRFPLSPTGLLVFDLLQEAKAVNNETRLVSQGVGPFQWLVGVFYSDTELTETAAYTPAILPTSVQEFKSESISVFAETSWSFLDGRLIPLVGLRYFEDDRSTFSDSFSVQPRPDTFDSVNPRFNLSYQPTVHSHYYLNIAKGFRSGSFNNPDIAALHRLGGMPCEDTLDSDELWSYEIGTKQALLDGQLLLDVALYYQDWQDMRNLVPTFGLFQEYHVGDAELYGVDLGVVYNPPEIEGLTLQLTANWNSSEIVDIDPAITAATGAKAGDRLPFVPDWTATISASYSREVAAGWIGQLFLGYNHLAPQSGQFGQPSVGDSRDLLRVRIGVEKDRFGVYLFGSNLLGEDGAIYSQEVPGGATGYTMDYPRQLGVEVQFNY